ncbi:phosphate acyltransferase PlsX [bacterium]|nr:phosphate acyltransferase PlsX [bacterium]
MDRKDSDLNNGIKWIALDAMGGDNAPSAIVQGAVIAASKGVHVILVGDEKVIRKELGNSGGDCLKIFHASEQIEMGDSPVRAMKKKPDNSLARAFELARDKKASAVLSAGNSGAMLVAAKWVLGDTPGIFRPAIAIPMPTPKVESVLLDAGVSTDCSPENLYQFAVMGHFYAKKVLKKEKPSIALLNIGEEKSKGNVIVQRAHEFLSESKLNFIGNIEGNEIFDGKANVIVCDGFIGNIMLKTLEGTATVFFNAFREIVSSSGWKERLGAMLISGSVKSIRRKMDWREYGGALIMGVKGNVVITHGKSQASTIANALEFAQKLANANLAGSISEEIANNMKETAVITGASDDME